MDPIRLKITNFYSIADGEIDFSLFSSALILGRYENNALMSNGAGKSTILEAIYWSLFNKTRQTKMDDIIRWTTNETCVEFEFMFDQRIYKIVRRRSRIAKESAVSLFVKEGGRWINDSGSINSETDNKILNLLKIDAKIFLNSVYFKQHDISLFANAKPAERKEIIKSIMKLERWDEYQQQAKNKLKNIEDDIEKQLRIVHDNPNLIAELNKINISIEDLKNQINILVDTNRKKQVELNLLYELKKEKSLFNLKNKLNDNFNKINELKVRGKDLQYKQLELQQKINNDIDNGKKYSQQLLNIENDIALLNDSILKIGNVDINYESLEQELLSLRISSGKLKADIAELYDTSSMLSLGQCQVCLSDIDESNLKHIHNNREIKIQELSNKYDIENSKLELINNEYENRKSTREALDRFNADLHSLNIMIDKINVQKTIVDTEVLKLNNENNILSTSLVSIIEQIKTLKIDSDTIEKKIAEQKINNIDNQIKCIEDELVNLRDLMGETNINLGTALKEKDFISNRIVLLNNATDILAKLKQDKIVYKQLVRSFGKEGIQAVFIESVVDELEYYANETLSHICNEPTVIKLCTQKKMEDSWKETLEIDVIMNGFAQTFESLSGGERFRISLALRIGLSEVLVKRAGGEIKMLLLDEVDSPLDTYGLDKMMSNIVSGLEKRFKIMVISHNSNISERFSNVINVLKTSNGSFIKQ